MAYLGASPPAVFSAPTKDIFSGNNSDTTFTLGKSAGGANAIEVFVDNVRQEPNVAYTVNDKTLTFTSAPATGSSNIYVINKSTVIGNGLIPVPGRDSDRVTTMTVDGNSTVKGNLNTKGNIAGNVLHPITLDGTDGSSSNAGDNLILDGTDSSSSNTGDMILHEINTDDINKVGQVDTSTFQFDNNVLVKGSVEVQGNLKAPTTGDTVVIETGTDATTGFLLLDSSAASTDVGEQILFEDGTGDPSNFFNNNITFSGDVELSKSVTAKTQVIESPGATTTLDFENNQNFIIKIGANLTLSNSATGNLNIGQTGVIVFIQDATGSRTLTLSSDFESPAAGGITLTTTAKATDIVPYIILGPNRILLGTPQLAFG